MKDALVIIAGLITVGAVIPYILDILKGKTKPNLVSWITWTLLTGLATSAAISAGEIRTAIFTGAAVIGTMLVVLLGLRKGYVKYTRFDVCCQLGVVLGLLLWQLFDSPAAAVIASVVIDFIGAMPTIRHSWQKPHEETWLAYAISSFGGVLAVFSLENYNWVSLPYAIYIVVANIIILIVLFSSPNREAKAS